MNKRTTISIPFPAWDTIFQVGDICDELRRNDSLRGIPVHRTPRRIEILEKGEGQIDDVKVIECWFTQGCYVTATIRGSDDSYGTSWKIVSLWIRWSDHVLHLPCDEEKVSLRINENQVAAIAVTAYLRTHLCDFEGKDNFEAAKAHLGKYATISDAIIAELADPIYKRYKEALAGG
ncbi:MAG TPA: hypothetical protein VMV71_02835 [Candidatus Paceibacterota bacterium]|nr:hypothetical protein [Candidatus Paceibacterota bacterium]